MTRPLRLHRIRWLFGLHSVTSLAYEILWMKMLEPRLGMSTAALGTVLAVFILGLGVGSALIGALSRRRSFSPRTAVCAAETGLALWALVFPFSLRIIDAVYTQWAPSTESLLHHGVRVIVAMGLLLPATSLIGIVFPVLVEATENDASEKTVSTVSRLYYYGLLGSAAGCFVLPAFLIHLGGLSGANAALAGLSAAVALAAYVFLPSTEQTPYASRALPPSIVNAAAPFPVYFASFMLGACLFMVEVVGGHFVWLQVTSTFYSNGILIGTVLIFMGLGSWIYGQVRGRRAARAGLVSVGLAFFAAAVVVWMLWPYPIAQLYHTAATGYGRPLWRFFFSTTLLVSLILAGPALAAGFVYPGLCELTLTSSRGRVTSGIGVLTAWNYLGSMIGSLAATFYFIPCTGMTWTLSWAALAGALAAAVLGFSQARRGASRFAILAGWGIFVPVCFLLGRSTNITYPDLQGGKDHQIIFHHEDAVGLVEVFEDLDTGDRSLYSNRLRMEGSDAPGEDIYKAFQGALPVLLHPSPRRVLVVGLGTGASLTHNLRPDVESLTCIEYAPGMVAAAAYFEKDNERVLSDPRVRLLHQDGRNFIKLSRSTYDVIIQDLFFPYQTGVGNLYTLEHFKAIRAHLSPGGRFGQWIPLHEIGPEELKSLIQTFRSVFSSTTLWLDNRFLLLYGGAEPLRLSWPALKKRMKGAGRLPETTPEDLFNFYVTDERAADVWSTALPNTDNNLLIETRTPLLFDQLDDARTGFLNMLSVAQWRQPVWPMIDGLSAEEASRLKIAAQARTFFYQGVQELLRGEDDAARNAFQSSYRLNPADYQNRAFLETRWFERAEKAFLEKAWSAAERNLQRALAVNPSSRSARYLRAEIIYEQGEHDESIRQFKKLITEYPRYYQARMALGDRLAAVGNVLAASAQFIDVAEHLPRSVDARFKLANMLLRLGRKEDAAALYEEVLRLDPGHPGAATLLPLARPPSEKK